MTKFNSPPITDELPISIRAYAVPVDDKLAKETAKRPKRQDSRLKASLWTLIFDTETSTDPGQALRFGTYQLRKAGTPIEKGIFYDPKGVTKSELALMRAHTDREGVVLRDRDSFIDDIFFHHAYRLDATIIGFNLPFDISRLAIDHQSARVPNGADAHPMRGAFTFKLSHKKYYPNVRIKHMNSRAALISFAAPMGQPDSRGQRGREIRKPIKRGNFIDIKTLSAALFAKSFSLKSLSEFLAVPNPKIEFDDFDGRVTNEMLVYAMRDTQTSWECYAALIERFKDLKLDRTRAEQIYSEAGIGKAYLKQMGIKPWREVQYDFPDQLTANIMGSYYGGRSEVRIRRHVRQVMLCDFLSMYPTACTLMGLWRFAIARELKWRDATADARELIEAADLANLQSQSIWAQLQMLVRIKPDADIVPVRAAYEGAMQPTIGANYLTSDFPMWLTLADCIASKLLTGKAPEIIEALAFMPGPPQADLCPINIAGNSDYRVDPYKEDFFKRVIELRHTVKEQRKGAPAELADKLDIEQHSLKICANSTSYGIWVEVNVEAFRKQQSVAVHSSTNEPFNSYAHKVEKPGTYFHPLLASLITGGARLMLAIAERLAVDARLDWVFCDTDSMAFAKPFDMDGNEFATRVQIIVDWFASLNPYDFGGSILKIEDVNYTLDGGELEPLFCLAISSKRYALFNLDSTGAPITCKISAHGLGHLRAPYSSDDAPSDLPTPDSSVLRDGTARWHCDLWHQIVSAALNGHLNRVALDYHPALDQPVTSRYAATSPELLRWFKRYNDGRDYRDQVKPFGFMLSLQTVFDPTGETFVDAIAKRGRPRKQVPIKPVAPFENELERAVARAFDRQTGETVNCDSLASYAEVLAAYHLSPENKFLNGDYFDSGPTARRHVRAVAVTHIGKEAHDWERQVMLRLDEEALVEYGTSREERSRWLELVRSFVASDGIARAARMIGTPVSQLRSIIAETRLPANHVRQRLVRAIADHEKRAADRDAEFNRLRARIAEHGLRKVARELGCDPSNLRRRIATWKQNQSPERHDSTSKGQKSACA